MGSQIYSCNSCGTNMGDGYAWKIEQLKQQGIYRQNNSYVPYFFCSPSCVTTWISEGDY